MRKAIFGRRVKLMERPHCGSGSTASYTWLTDCSGNEKLHISGKKSKMEKEFDGLSKRNSDRNF
jgi:hypothetical protein